MSDVYPVPLQCAPIKVNQIPEQMRKSIATFIGLTEVFSRTEKMWGGTVYYEGSSALSPGSIEFGAAFSTAPSERDPTIEERPYVPMLPYMTEEAQVLYWPKLDPIEPTSVLIEKAHDIAITWIEKSFRQSVGDEISHIQETMQNAFGDIIGGRDHRFAEVELPQDGIVDAGGLHVEYLKRTSSHGGGFYWKNRDEDYVIIFASHNLYWIIRRQYGKLDVVTRGRELIPDVKPSVWELIACLLRNNTIAPPEEFVYRG